MRFEPAPEYQVFPTRERPLKPYEAAVRAARETQPLIRDVDPDVGRGGHPHDRRGAGGGDGGAARGRRSSRTCCRSRSRGFPPYSIGARLPRTPVGAASVARARPDRADRHRARPRRAERDAPAARAGAARPRARRDLARSSRSSRRSRSSSTRARSSWPWMRVTGPLMYERPADDVELPPGDEPLVLDRAQHLAGPRPADAARGAGRARGRAGARARGDEPPRRACGRAADPSERARRRLALLHAHDAALRGGRLPRGPRHRRARAGERRAAGGLPGRGRHGRERGARGVGGRRRLATAPPRDRARDQAGGAAAAARPELRDPGAGTGGLGELATTARSTPPESWRKSSGGGTRTHNPSINSRSLCH